MFFTELILILYINNIFLIIIVPILYIYKLTLFFKNLLFLKKSGLVPVGIEPTTLALLAPRSNQTEL